MSVYVNDTNVYKCPETDGTIGRGGHGSYGYNCQIQGIKLTTSQAVSEVPSFADANCHYINPHLDRTGGCTPCNLVTPCPRVAWGRHNNGLNLAFTDGHVAWMPRTKADARTYPWNVH